MVVDVEVPVELDELLAVVETTWVVDWLVVDEGCRLVLVVEVDGDRVDPELLRAEDVDKVDDDEEVLVGEAETEDELGADV